jgi:small subunit ribosomal protein S17
MAEKKNEKEHSAGMQVPAGNERVYAVRGNVFEGKVISAKANKTVTVERQLIQYLPKYERYKKIRSRVKAHNPENINAKEGDLVRIGETRRISKTKAFIVLEVLEHKKE